MRRNPGTVVVLAGSVPGAVLATVGRSLNVALIRPEQPTKGENADGLVLAADALRRAGRIASPYALVAADPLVALAASWQAMWDVAQPGGAADFEREAVTVLAAWRAGAFELPDYYLALSAADSDMADAVPDFYLGPLRAVRPNRVAFVTAAEPAQQAAGLLHELGSLKHGPWWPPLPDIIEIARGFYPGRLADSADVEVPRSAPTQG